MNHQRIGQLFTHLPRIRRGGGRSREATQPACSGRRGWQRTSGAPRRRESRGGRRRRRRRRRSIRGGRGGRRRQRGKASRGRGEGGRGAPRRLLPVAVGLGAVEGNGDEGSNRYGVGRVAAAGGSNFPQVRLDRAVRFGALVCLESRFCDLANRTVL